MGYPLVFGVLDLLNLAHSAVFMIGAFVVFSSSSPPACLLAGHHPELVAGAVVGVVIERDCFAPLRSRPDTHFAGLISSFSLAIIFGAITLAVFGPNLVQLPPRRLPRPRATVLGAPDLVAPARHPGPSSITLMVTLH